MADGLQSADQSVAVTGLGIVSPVGSGHQQFWHALCAGESGIRSLAHTSAQLPYVGGHLADFFPRDVIRSAHLRRMDKLSRMVVSASRMALDDAKLNPPRVAPERLGVVVGSGLGNVSESVQYLERLFTKGPALASPMIFPNLVLNAPASYTAMDIGCMGVNLTVSQGETSGENAVALACELIRAGQADVVLAGGGDELDEVVIAAYGRYRALSSQRGGREWCSPYDVERNGVVLGEGAAMLLLESRAHARTRGATPYAEIRDHISFGVPSPTTDWPAQAPSAVEPLRQLLVRSVAAGASSTSTAVDLVYGSANSSRRLDACELDIFGRLFGETASRVALTSLKGATGEFGAAGALTVVAACLALHHGVVPPLCNLRQPPPDVPFQLSARVAPRRALQRALVFSMARGGAAIGLLLSRPDDT